MKYKNLIILTALVCALHITIHSAQLALPAKPTAEQLLEKYPNVERILREDELFRPAFSEKRALISLTELCANGLIWKHAPGLKNLEELPAGTADHPESDFKTIIAEALERVIPIQEKILTIAMEQEGLDLPLTPFHAQALNNIIAPLPEEISKSGRRFHCAILKNHIVFIKLLGLAKIDLNKPIELCPEGITERLGVRDEIPLEQALINHKDCRMVNLLLELKADPNVECSHGTSPFQLSAIRCRNQLCPGALIKAGVHVDHINPPGSFTLGGTALMEAIRCADLPLVKMLVGLGATVHDETIYPDQTPLELAYAETLYEWEETERLTLYPPRNLDNLNRNLDQSIAMITKLHIMRFLEQEMETQAELSSAKNE